MCQVWPSVNSDHSFVDWLSSSPVLYHCRITSTQLIIVVKNIYAKITDPFPENAFTWRKKLSGGKSNDLEGIGTLNNC